MPSLVNKVPPGLLALLGIKAGGQNPSILPDTLTPTIELLELYVSGNCTEVNANTSAITNPQLWNASALPQPGAGEMFVVERMSIAAAGTLPAATTYRLQPIIYEPTGVRHFPVGPAVTATVNERLLSGNDRWFIVPPGYRMGIAALAVTLGTATAFTISARYVPLSL
jgi:hypothetical protein